MWPFSKKSNTHDDLTYPAPMQAQGNTGPQLFDIVLDDAVRDFVDGVARFNPKDKYLIAEFPCESRRYIASHADFQRSVISYASKLGYTVTPESTWGFHFRKTHEAAAPHSALKHFV